MIDNETALYQRPNDIEVNKYGSPYGLVCFILFYHEVIGI